MIIVIIFLFSPFIYLHDVPVSDHRSESTLISVCHNTMSLFSSTASCWDCRFPAFVDFCHRMTHQQTHWQSEDTDTYSCLWTVCFWRFHFSPAPSQECFTPLVTLRSYSWLVHGLENEREEMQAFQSQFSHPIMLMCCAGVSVSRADGAVPLK